MCMCGLCGLWVRGDWIVKELHFDVYVGCDVGGCVHGCVCVYSIHNSPHGMIWMVCINPLTHTHTPHDVPPSLTNHPPPTHTHSNYDASVFETTIRVVGGMLSAYELTGDTMYVYKAAELVDRLLPAFDTPTGLPYNTINLQTLVAHNPSWARSVWWLCEVH